MAQVVEAIDRLGQDVLQGNESGTAPLPMVRDLENAGLGPVHELLSGQSLLIEGTFGDVAADLDELPQH